jgi:16S rRNA (adenine1518-N6/adenine1519-N6)-dimethyltransferase
MRAKKSLGQNFLMHARIAERIADAAALTRKDVVLEVGPGTGMLTRPLLARAGKVIAVEADAELAQGLRATFAAEIAQGSLELITGDIREFPLETLPEGYKVAANIPYYLTGELIRRLLTAERQPASMTLLVQKEVAERVAREKKGSLLALSVKAYGIPKYEFTVPRGAFRPAPNVDSAVLAIRGISRANFASTEEEARFFELLRAGFAHKRKFLAKNLTEAGIAAELSDPKARAEDLALSDWLALAKCARS